MECEHGARDSTEGGGFTLKPKIHATLSQESELTWERATVKERNKRAESVRFIVTRPRRVYVYLFKFYSIPSNGLENP